MKDKEVNLYIADLSRDLLIARLLDSNEAEMKEWNEEYLSLLPINKLQDLYKQTIRND